MDNKNFIKILTASLFILLLGIMFIIAGYTHQVTPSCDRGSKLKLVNREEFKKTRDTRLSVTCVCQLGAIYNWRWTIRTNVWQNQPTAGVWWKEGLRLRPDSRQ